MELAIKHLKKICDFSGNTLKFLTGPTESSIDTFLILILDRLNLSSMSLIPLLEQYEENTGCEHGVGIILRSAIFDAIMTYYLLSIWEKVSEGGGDEEKIKEQLNETASRFLSDGILFILKSLKRDINFQIKNSGELKEQLERFVSMYPVFFKHSCSIEDVIETKKLEELLYWKLVKSEEMFKAILHSPSLKNKKNLLDHYELYSKYDHFTLISFHLTRAPKAELKSRIYDCIEELFCHLEFLHFLLLCNQEKPFLKEQLTHITEYKIKHLHK